MRPRSEAWSPETREDTESSSWNERNQLERRSRSSPASADRTGLRASTRRPGARWIGLFALTIPTASVAGFGALASVRVRALASATRGVRPEAPIAAESPVSVAGVRAAAASLHEWSALAVAILVFVGCWALAIGGAHLVARLVARLLAGRHLAGR
jgi:hypothetical protein